MTSEVMKETNTKENLTIVTTLKTFERLKNVETTSKPKLERETMVLEDPVIRGQWSVEAGSNATWTCQTNATFENSSDVSVTWYVDGLPDERATCARTSLGNIPAINFSVPLYTVNCELRIRTPTIKEAKSEKTMKVECRAWHVRLGNGTYLVAVRNVTLVTPQFSADHFNTTTNGTSEASPRDNIEANDSYENLTGAAADEHTNFNTKKDSTRKGSKTVWVGLIGALGGVVVLSTIVLLGMNCQKDPVFDRSLAKNSMQLRHRRNTSSQSRALGLGPAGQGTGHSEAPNATQGDMFRAVYGTPRPSEWSGEDSDPLEPEPVRSEWNRRDSEDISASPQSEGSSESDLSEQTESAYVLEEQGHPTGH
ncbi:uncharacterized protein [Littorina saxatilis]|uniref:uncharacterized protein n=1 Tax=Littorina saxatilis TaxID=31220 RepID=UPI0038B5CB15